MYNITQLQQADTVSKLMTYANESVGGILFGLFLIAFFIVMVMALKRYDFTSALLSSGFATAIIASILAYGNLVTIYFPLGFWALTALTALFVYVAEG